jgi:DNA-directed RNA polymerase sigma subunit (sigma70/sigma32)
MPRVRSKLNKTSQQKINNFFKESKELLENYTDINNFIIVFNDIVLKDVKGIKEGTEKTIVDYYIAECKKLLIDNKVIILPLDDFIKILQKKVRTLLINKYTNNSYSDIIDIYFNDIRKEYIAHPQNESNDLDFLPEHKDIFITNNLKLVISIAKKYRNFGLPFEDLIQAGNYGLMIAFDRFDASRNTLRRKIIDDIEITTKTVFTKDEAINILSRHLTYDNMLGQMKNSISDTGFDSKESFTQWVKQNVKTAVFASVAYRWIESYIKQELDHYRTTIKFPKSKTGSYFDDSQVTSNGNYVISLDSINPYTDDNYNDNLLEEVVNEDFVVYDEYIVNQEKNEYYKSVLDIAFKNLSNLDRRIIKKKFGIGFPSELTYQEIAESEGLSISEVKDSVNKTILHIKNNVSDDIKTNLLELFV